MTASVGNKHWLKTALEWIEQDPDPETQKELTGLLEAQDEVALRERLDGVLEFGTAGLRAPVGAGSLRMNRAVVIRTTAGLVEYLRQTTADLTEVAVVVGRDARLSSKGFADDVCQVLSAVGIEVRYFADPVPTPLVAYAVRELRAKFGIMITASHNSREYNGYKVFSANGAQILFPLDRQIAECVAGVKSAVAVLAKGGEPRESEVIPPGIFERYLAEVLANLPTGAKESTLAIAYTPLHGVGSTFVKRALERAGFSHVSNVVEQAEPDGAFPTVAFPNPEEPAALSHLFAHARATQANLALANDPDVDRLAVAIPDATGEWRPLTGNQIGLLLAEYLLIHNKAKKPLVVSTLVSSPALTELANLYGAHHERTLTGFKWIWSAALELERNQGYTFIFGYEEALGYSVAKAVRDKDGISAAIAIARLADIARVEGGTLWDRLESLYKKIGYWVSGQKSVALPEGIEPNRISAGLSRVVEHPPGQLQGVKVTRIQDYRSGAEQRARWLGTSPLIELGLANGARVLLRPSGTEPKIKIYTDWRVPLEERHHKVQEKADALAAELAELLQF